MGATEACVVDTNVLSYFLKEPPDSRAALYEPHLDGKDIVIAFMTLAELRSWALERNWGQRRRQRRERSIQRELIVHHTDDALCHMWAQIDAEGRRRGQEVPVDDAWIAATALALGLPFVTHNRRDFAAIPGLTIISEAPA